VKCENHDTCYAVLYIVTFWLLYRSTRSILSLTTLSVYAFLHCSIALAFGHQFLTVEACVQYGEGRVMFVVDRLALGQDFVSVLQFHTSLLCILAFGRRSLKLKF